MESDFFGSATFAFLSDLAENNSKEWFGANRRRYEETLKEPAQRFILAMGDRLPEFSPSLRADPRPLGGSLFRIHRDLRFSKDKTPYKTHVGVQFRHLAGKDAHAPGVYVHIEADECFVGLGVWRPASAPLRAIREAIVDSPDGWATAVEALTRSGLSLAGESLKRIPRGFDADHPLASDLRRKDFIAVAPLAPQQVLAPDLPDAVMRSILPGASFFRFVCDALGVQR